MACEDDFSLAYWGIIIMPRGTISPVSYVSVDDDLVNGVLAESFTNFFSSGSTLPDRVGGAIGPVLASPAPLLVLEAVANVTEIIANVTTIARNLAELGEILVPDQCCEDIKELLTVTLPDDSKVGLAQMLYKAFIYNSIVDGLPVSEGIVEVHSKIRDGLYWQLDDGTLVPLGESLGRLVYTGVLHAGGS